MAVDVVAQAAGGREMPGMLVTAHSEAVDTHIEIQMQSGAVRRDQELWPAHAEIDQSADRVVSAWIMPVGVPLQWGRGEGELAAEQSVGGVEASAADRGDRDGEECSGVQEIAARADQDGDSWAKPEACFKSISRCVPALHRTAVSAAPAHGR